MIEFCFDQLAARHVGYPNLARFSARPYTPEWRQFEQHYPRTVPLRLLMYLKHLGITWKLSTTDNYNSGAWYPVGLGWFDFTFDYFGAMSDFVRRALKQKQLKVLFYYHEGDNPFHIKQRLNELVAQYSLPMDCYVFVSANTAAQKINNFVYFPDHEFFFGFVNREQRPKIGNVARNYTFTMLSRTHKAWRASVVSDLHRHQLLDHSLWSYGLVNDTTDEGEDPIQSLSDPIWAQERQAFISNAPYMCDTFNTSQQNDHHVVNNDLYTRSYCHIVLETHFDADGSGGTFLTEKTYKCIKYGQPFVIAGPQGSLQALRDAGYRTFDSTIDNEYDNISDNTQRWIALRNTITAIKNHTDHRQWLRSCQIDCDHNQRLFAQRMRPAVNSLLERLT